MSPWGSLPASSVADATSATLTQSLRLQHTYRLSTILDAPPYARLGGVVSMPLVPSATNWTQHRVFVLDSNAQHIYAATEWAAGAPTSK